MIKAGSYIQLVQAVREGRVLRRLVSGLPMFYFPRREFIKETAFSQAVQGDINKEGGDLEEFEHAADGQLGFNWDPTGENDDDLKMLPLQAGKGLGDLSLGDGGLCQAMGFGNSSSTPPMGFGNPTPMGFGNPTSLGFGNGSSTPTSMGFGNPTSLSFGNGTSTPTSTMGFGNGGSTPLSDEAKKELAGCLQELGKSLALAVRVLGASQASEGESPIYLYIYILS